MTTMNPSSPTPHEIVEYLHTMPGVVLIDFVRDHCRPCAVMAPIVEALSKEYPEVTFAPINVGDAPEIVARYGVTAFPTFVILRDGQVQAVLAGQLPGAKLQEAIENALKV